MLNHYEDIRENLWFWQTSRCGGFVHDPRPAYEERVKDDLCVEIRRFRSDEDEKGDKVAIIQCSYFRLEHLRILSPADFLTPFDSASEGALFIGEYLLKHYVDEDLFPDYVPNVLLITHIEMPEKYRGGNVEMGLIKDLADVVGERIHQSVEFVAYFLEQKDMSSIFQGDEQTQIIRRGDDLLLPFIIYDTVELE